ncbi:porin family protein [Shewanella septentrionalis]|uniref:Porin family protein n=1 Tax=Shewanella septentrionalis TaxID=2952223 RepID=A0A9X2WYL8_9GAMM|nr:porin family protein [Shewanella septentrionalis]MCT7947696.1 porin family protein [Shewanella septentrionalis]
MKQLLLMAALASLSTSALATDTIPLSPDYRKDDMVWIGADIGKASIDTNTADDGYHGQVKLGYDINQYAAIYGGIGGISVIDGENISFAQMGVKLTKPLTERLSLYATLGGVSALSGDVSQQLKGNLGIGASYAITPRVSTQLGIDLKKGIAINSFENTDVNTLYWGLTYHFDRPDTSRKVIQQVNIIR